MMAIAIRKSLLKETTISNSSFGGDGKGTTWASVSNERAVYMNNGDEFQIQLFNPEQVKVACEVFINGIKMSDRKIVLRPGERVWLDRHIDSPEKLKFETYEVSRGKEVRKAIEKNGVVEVKFYKERDIEHVKLTTTYVYQPYTLDNGIRYGSSVCDANTVLGMVADNADLACTHQCDSAASVATAFSALTTGDCEIKASACADHQQSRHMETGRVEKGGHSNQEFNNVYDSFESWSFHNETVHILPMSEKPVHKSDLQKRFCPYCGRKIKDNFIFCPHCGKEL